MRGDNNYGNDFYYGNQQDPVEAIIKIDGKNYFIWRGGYNWVVSYAINGGSIDVHFDRRMICISKEFRAASALIKHLTNKMEGNMGHANQIEKTEKGKVDSAKVTKDYALALISGLIDSAQKGEWGSMSMNLTYGPGEAPVAFISFLPGTSKDNALRIQNGFLTTGAQLNQG